MKRKIPVLILIILLMSMFMASMVQASPDENPQNNGVSFPTIPEGKVYRTYGDPDFIFTALSDYKIAYSSSDETIAQVDEDDGSVHILKAGEVIITAKADIPLGFGNDEDSYQLIIDKKSVMVSGIVALNKPYDGNTEAELTYWDVKYDGLLEGDSLKVSATGNYSDPKVGRDKSVSINEITLYGEDADNYKLLPESLQTCLYAAIERKAVTIDGLSVEDKIYDGTRTAVVTGEAYVKGVLDGEDVGVTPGYARFYKTDVGMQTAAFYNYRLEGADCPNYYLTNPPSNVEAMINPRPITGAKVTLGRTRVVYDGKKQYVRVDKLQLDDKVLDPETDYTVSGEHYGTDKGVYTLTVTGINNYTGSVDADWIITDKIIKVYTSGVNVTYDGKPHGITVTVDKSVSENEVLFGLEEGIYDLPQSPALTDVGQITVYYKVSAPGYYDETGSALVTVTHRPVTVAADDKSKTTGSSDPVLTASITGLIKSASQNSIDYFISRIAGESPGTYPIIIHGEELQGNYRVKYVKGTMTINPAGDSGTSDESHKDGSQTDEKDGGTGQKEEVSIAVKTVGGTELKEITYNKAFAVKQKVDASAYLGAYKKYEVLPKGAAKIDKKKRIITIKKASDITITAYDKANGSLLAKETVSLKACQPVVKEKVIDAAVNKAAVNGADNIDDGDLMPDKWESSKTNVATVDEKTGVITPLAKGKTVIYAYYGTGKNAARVKFKIRVN